MAIKQVHVFRSRAPPLNGMLRSLEAYIHVSSRNHNTDDLSTYERLPSATTRACLSFDNGDEFLTAIRLSMTSYRNAEHGKQQL